MAKRALLIADMLNDFVKEGGTLIVKDASGIVPAIKTRIDQARSDGTIVIYITDAHRPDDPEFKDWPPHAIPGTWGQKVIDELAPEPQDFIVLKRRYSGFFMTQLDLVLREEKITDLIITGVLTNICVFFTAVEGRYLTYDVSVPRDSVASTSREDHEWALGQLPLHGIKVI